MEVSAFSACFLFIYFLFFFLFEKISYLSRLLVGSSPAKNRVSVLIINPKPDVVPNIVRPKIPQCWVQIHNNSTTFLLDHHKLARELLENEKKKKGKW